MPAANFTKSSTPLNGVPAMITHKTATAIQSGPYTKAQFQSTMEGSRTIKTSKEVEHILRDYPAALELYRTGKYKVKVKCEANVERVILVEKKAVKTTTNKNQDNNQIVPDGSSNMEQNREIENEQNLQQSRSRTQSRERIAPTTSVTNGHNIVHATISSTLITNDNHPKVDHHRTPSNEREISVASQKKQPINQHNHSSDSQHKALNNNQQGDKVNRDCLKMIMPYVPQANKSGNQWQQPRFQTPYYSNPLLQQQQRSNSHMPVPYIPQQNPRYQHPYYYRQRPTTPINFHPQPSLYPLLPSTPINRKPNLHSMNNYPTSTQSVTNIMALPPTMHTFHTNQQQQKFSSLRPMYQSQIPFPMNHPLPNMANEPLRNVRSSSNTYIEQQRGVQNRAPSINMGQHNNLPVHSSNIPQQTGTAVVEQYRHHHHQHQHHHHHRFHPTNNVGNGKEQNVTSKEQTRVANVEKLTVRQLTETFNRIDPSGRVPYTTLPGILQRFGIILTDNDISSAAKDLEYNLNEPVSARRLIHILVKLGKITKSSQQQQRQPVSPSMLPEDREVTDIMTQRNTTNTYMHSSNQPNQQY
ncbi:unnamed protein product [Rotaria sordida]|uniref:Uncharacterized protein n=1 Tax=Rotaria sordida TaxID=392033 RepID=A0A819IPT6_9BILA|nr:unnamed protein product [Rotaria sordida]